MLIPFACLFSVLAVWGSPPPAISIQVDRGAVYRLAAVVEPGSAHSVSGTYSLVVLRDGASGRSQTRQGGAFDVRGPGSHVLSTQSVSAAPGDHIAATLTVTWADGQIARESFEETVGMAPAR